MSLYNMLLGEHPHRETLMGILKLRRRDCGRFRDVYCKDDGTSIYVFTRNSNMDWCQPINEMLRNRPDFLMSWKDSFDNTFMTFEFRTPSESIEKVKWVADQTDNRPPMVRYKELITDLGSDKDTPQVARAKKVGEKIVKQIMSDKSGKVTNESGGVDILRLDK
jgi:hypothetical protein